MKCNFRVMTEIASSHYIVFSVHDKFETVLNRIIPLDWIWIKNFQKRGWCSGKWGK